MDKSKYPGTPANIDEPARELLLWEEWIQIRKEETEKLAQKIKRPPVDLVMNLLENVRVDKERKTVLEHAQISKKPGIRGTLWEQPQRLKQSCNCQPAYEVQRTKAEMGIPSVIEHIGAPEYIQKSEKGLVGQSERVVCSKLNSEYIKYRERREHDLKAKVKKLDPFRAQTSELVVRGMKPKPPPKKLPPNPVITITSESGSSDHLLSSIYAIRINNTILFKDGPDQFMSHLKKMQEASWHECCTSWTYYFNSPVKRAGRSKLFLQNLGNVTLRYCWKKIKKTLPYIPEGIYEQVFFFNKNEDVLSPGQSKLLSFTFISDTPGIFSEVWELYLSNICFFDTLASKLVINLNADAVEDLKSTNRNVEILKFRIDRKAVFNFITLLLNDVLTKALTIEPKTYAYKNKFLERDLFVMKNPLCFYHQTRVVKMKKNYTEMVPGEIWDLSIASWRIKMMEKEYEERMKYYEILRKSHSELLKPWYENEELVKQKYRMMKIFLAQMADKFDKEYDRLLHLYCPVSRPPRSLETASKSQQRVTSKISIRPITSQNIRNIFYIHAYEYVATAIEMCTGVLSSLDLNRWIHFDFCYS